MRGSLEPITRVEYSAKRHKYLVGVIHDPDVSIVLVWLTPRQYALERWSGVERMPFVNFKKLSEEQLKQELEKIRTGRLSTGKGARRASRERRIKDGARKERQVDPNAIKVDITIEE